MEFIVIQGDIAQQSADALVNAAGTSLKMVSGVAGALRRKGGEALNEAAIAKGPVELGEVATTDAFGLDAEYVIHAAAMPHYGDGNATPESIERATRNALNEADELGCKSVVLPVFGTGAAGVDFETGARIVCRSIDEFDPAHLELVEVIAYDEAQFAQLRSIASSV